MHGVLISGYVMEFWSYGLVALVVENPLVNAGDKETRLKQLCMHVIKLYIDIQERYCIYTHIYIYSFKQDNLLNLIISDNLIKLT